MKNTRGTLPVKKTLITAALVASLSVVAIGCDNDDDATPEPTTPAEAVESMAAEEVEAVESMAAEEVEAVESMAADAEEDATE
jgi:hypothetical protein